ncbi:MAG TPA: hypothetical protein EYP56_21720 [Planctomycetaceae bacterium]|nr:hypothetical protein [Planctomycetaceae bacterium]
MDETRQTEGTGEQEILREFAEEAREHLATVSEGLLELEREAADPDVVNSIFRGLHTIKGVSSFLGLSQINCLSHAGESLLDGVRNKAVDPTPEVVDALLETCDVLSRLIEHVADMDPAEPHSSEVEPLVTRLRQLAGRAPAGKAPATPKPGDEASSTQSDEQVDALWPAPGTGLDPELVKQFTAEHVDTLQQLEESVLRLEEDPGNVEEIKTVFRAVHSIKGTADYVGLAQTKALAHCLEDLLELVRRGRLALVGEVSELLFAGTDELRWLIEHLRDDGEAGRDLRDLVRRLRACAEKTVPPDQASGGASPCGARPTGDPRLDVFIQSASQQIESIRIQTRKLLDGDGDDSSRQALERALATLENAAQYMGREEFVGPCREFLGLVTQLPAAPTDTDRDLTGRLDSLTEELERMLQEFSQ